MNHLAALLLFAAFAAHVCAQSAPGLAPAAEAPAEWFADEPPAEHSAPLNTADTPTTAQLLTQWEDMPTTSARFRFLSAAFMGDDELIQSLLSRGADINEIAPPYGYTILHQAALTNYTTAVTTLLRNGANPNLTAGNSFPLYDTVGPENLDVFKALLEGGADPDLAENLYGSTPLHAAVLDNLSTQTRLLLAAGANPDKPNGQGVAPLHLAISLRRTEMTKLLLENGADPNLPTQRGTRPIDVAKRSADPFFLDLLLQHGAQE